MENKKSLQDMLEFLEYVAQKGLMAPSTARSRKASVSKVLGILDSHEVQDVTLIDLDDVMRRFNNLEGKNYTPHSLTTYKSRIRSSLDDFSNYIENPLSFKPNVQTRERKKFSDKVSTNTTPKKTEKKDSENSYHQSSPVVTRSMASTILPIPIRADLTIHIQGLPFDLTEGEANKIASVVKAMAMSG